jgi:hypothetical protein
LRLRWLSPAFVQVLGCDHLKIVGLRQSACLGRVSTRVSRCFLMVACQCLTPKHEKAITNGRPLRYFRHITS